MMQKLQVLAGQMALSRIRDGGLSPANVTAVIGASGAAKWLTIVGLDRAVFGRWLVAAEHEIDLFGTSIGAFKLAAAAQEKPVEALDRLAQAYVDQHYAGKITPDSVSTETRRILEVLLPQDAPAQILAHPVFRFSCASVRCHGRLGSGSRSNQKLAMAAAFVKSALGREAFRGVVERVVFADPRSPRRVEGGDGYPTERVDLSLENVAAALEASGSIPVLMNGVEEIAGAKPGVYRDGGLLDYHPIPGNFWTDVDGLIVYPHFYDHLKARWFDKFFARRRVIGGALHNVVLLAPSTDYVRSLPGGRIPAKEDFARFANDDAERVRRWTIAVQRSHELGDEFIELVESGQIRQRVRGFEGP